jgi:hypothetical protein
MPKTKFVELDKNIVTEVLNEINPQNKILVFNSHSEISFAQIYLQNKIGFFDNKMILLSEFENKVLVSDYPLLKEDRRLISFYNSLSSKNKDYFKISDYFQSIKFAYKFFNFWEEYTSNMLNESNFKQKLNYGSNFDNEKQSETFEFLKDVKKDYKEYINKNEFSDVIFRNEDLVINEITSDLIFINVPNFSNLNRYIFQNYENKGYKVIIYFWGNPQIFDEKKLSLKPFDFSELKNLNKKNINVYLGNNFDNSFYFFLENQKSHNSDFLIDFKLEENPYFHFLNPDVFNLENNFSFKNSSVFHFFITLYSLFQNMIFEKKEELYLIPIYSLLNAIKEKSFAKYFLDENENECLITNTIEFLNNLWENKSLRYLDLENSVLKHFKNNYKICNFIKRITGFLFSLLSIKNLKSFGNLIGKNEPIEISRILTEDEIKKYNFLELFYRTLADFTITEEILNIKNWGKMFRSTKFKNKDIAISQGIIRLFLEYLKSKKTKIKYMESTDKIKLSEFSKSNFIINKNISIINLIENNLPSKTKNSFFWTENQRYVLGLATMKDVSVEDKYQLYRLLSLAKSSDLYAYNDAEENIEISSFLEELMLGVANVEIINNDKNYSHQKLAETNLVSKGERKINPEYKKDKKFYSFNFDKKYINKPFSYYSLSLLLKNPFMYLLNNLKINDIEVSDKLYFSNKFLGILIHSVLNNNWQRIIEVHKSTTFSHNFIDFENDANMDKSLKSYINRNLLYYFQTPHDFSSKYFDLIIRPLIIENSTYFFKKFAETYGFNNKIITVFAEKNEAHEKSQPKTIFPKNDKITKDIKIKVRADLRVESQDSKVIIDYKTGSGSDDQLLIYERYYYENFNDVKSAIFSFFDKKFDKEIKSNVREKKFEKLTNKFEKIFAKIQIEGFSIPNKNYKLYDNQDLSRTDLFIKYGRQSWLNQQK